jgi:hypothetical protein
LSLPVQDENVADAEHSEGDDNLNAGDDDDKLEVSYQEPEEELGVVYLSV